MLITRAPDDTLGGCHLGAAAIKVTTSKMRIHRADQPHLTPWRRSGSSCGNSGQLWLLILTSILMWSSVRCSNTLIQAAYEFMEEKPANSIVGNITKSANLPAGLLYSILPLGNPSLEGLFVIGRTDGILRSARRIDRDRLSICENKVDCVIVLEIGVRGSDGYASLVKVSIHLLDLNDNHPTFPNANLELAISETAQPGIRFVIPAASDPDGGRYGIQSYHFLLGGNEDVFEGQVTNNSDGTYDLHLILKERLDREDMEKYKMQVVSKDGGIPRLSGVLNILVTVLDANDNTPTFVNNTYTIHIKENKPLNTTIVTVKAMDQDEGLNGQIVYEFTPETFAEYGNVFVISNTSGNIYLKEPLDFEKDNSYRLVVRAHDRGADPIYVHAKVFIHVQDVNDNAPKIKVNALTATGDVEIPENADPGAFVAHVTVEDGDSGRYGDIMCFLNDKRFDLKELYETAYRIETKVPFDREYQEHYIVRLRCEDRGNPPLSSMKDIHVKILDRNDHAPIFSRSEYTSNVPENNSYHLQILTVGATDRDVGENGRITYTLEGKVASMFNINPNTGLVSANSVLDYEKTHALQFFVVATDNGEQPRSATGTVMLNIIDVNDEPPIFSRPIFHFVTTENLPVGTEMGTVTAIDADGAPYNRVRYSLDPLRTDTETFAINARNGSITIKKILDREYAPLHNLVAVASNPDALLMRSSVNVSIHVNDMNDNAPMIIYPNPVNNTIKVPHLAPLGYAFGRIEALDADFGENQRLQFDFAKGNVDGLFDIDPNSGVLTTTKKIEKYENWAFNVIVTVKDHGQPRKTAASEFTIFVETSTHPIGSSASRASQGDGLSLNKHHIILIAMSLSTLFLVIILVTAIILVRRKHTPKDSHKDRSVKFSEIVQNSRDVDVTIGMNDMNMGLKGRTAADGDFCEDKAPTKEVKFNIANDSIEGEDVPPDLCGPGSPICRDNQPLQECPSPKASLVGSREPSPDPPAYIYHKSSTLPRYRLIDNPSDASSKPWNLSAKELEVHRLLQMSLKDQFQDSDSTSGCSAEVSNTDSGRGPSEDGDNHQRNHDNKTCNTQSGLSSLDHGQKTQDRPPPSYSTIDHSGSLIAGQKRKRSTTESGIAPPPAPSSSSQHHIHPPPALPHYQSHQYHHPHHPHHPHSQNLPHAQVGPPTSATTSSPSPNTASYLNIPRTYQPKGYKIVPNTQTLSRGPYRDPRECGGRRSPITVGRSGVDTGLQSQRQTYMPSHSPSLTSFQPEVKHNLNNVNTPPVSISDSRPPLTTTFGPGRTDLVLTSSGQDGSTDHDGASSGGGGGTSGHIANSIANNKRLLLPHVVPGLRDSVV